MLKARRQRQTTKKLLDTEAKRAKRLAKEALAGPGVEKEKVKKEKEKSHGFDAMNDRFGNMFDFGIVDPTKVVRSALQNAASVASLIRRSTLTGLYWVRRQSGNSRRRKTSRASAFQLHHRLKASSGRRRSFLGMRSVRSFMGLHMRSGAEVRESTEES